MQTIREFGSYIWTRPWLATILQGLNRLHLGLTYAAISAGLAALHRLISKRPELAKSE